MTLVLALPAPAEAQRTIRAHADRSPGIGEAVRQARAGDRVVVSAGVYREPTIVVDRPVTIIGERLAVLDGANATHILRVESDSVVVKGLTFQNVSVSHVEDRAAIRVAEITGCRIEENRFERAFFGIYLAGSVDCAITDNVLNGIGGTEAVTGNGIHLWTARGTEVRGNRITGHRDGIYLEFAHGSRVSDNVSERNIRYGLHFMYADDCRYERNRFRANQAGVAVMYTKRVTMIGNEFADNHGPSSYGLLLKEIYDSRLDSNRFERNTTALLADGATRLRATGNLFADNGWAVKIMASTQDAGFASNVFVRNTFDVATNSRGSSTTLTGNYWDEYQGYDLDRDGRGDVPHRPVRLFSLIVERHEPMMILLRSPMVALLDRAERILPSLTPGALADDAPLMRRPR